MRFFYFLLFSLVTGSSFASTKATERFRESVALRKEIASTLGFSLSFFHNENGQIQAKVFPDKDRSPECLLEQILSSGAYSWVWDSDSPLTLAYPVSYKQEFQKRGVSSEVDFNFENGSQSVPLSEVSYDEESETMPLFVQEEGSTFLAPKGFSCSKVDITLKVRKSIRKKGAGSLGSAALLSNHSKKVSLEHVRGNRFESYVITIKDFPFMDFSEELRDMDLFAENLSRTIYHPHDYFNFLSFKKYLDEEFPVQLKRHFFKKFFRTSLVYKNFDDWVSKKLERHRKFLLKELDLESHIRFCLDRFKQNLKDQLRDLSFENWEKVDPSLEGLGDNFSHSLRRGLKEVLSRKYFDVSGFGFGDSFSYEQVKGFSEAEIKEAEKTSEQKKEENDFPIRFSYEKDMREDIPREVKRNSEFHYWVGVYKKSVEESSFEDRCSRLRGMYFPSLQADLGFFSEDEANPEKYMEQELDLLVPQFEEILQKLRKEFDSFVQDSVDTYLQKLLEKESALFVQKNIRKFLAQKELKKKKDAIKILQKNLREFFQNRKEERSLVSLQKMVRSFLKKKKEAKERALFEADFFEKQRKRIPDYDDSYKAKNSELHESDAPYSLYHTSGEAGPFLLSVYDFPEDKGADPVELVKAPYQTLVKARDFLGREAAQGSPLESLSLHFDCFQEKENKYRSRILLPLEGGSTQIKSSFPSLFPVVGDFGSYRVFEEKGAFFVEFSSERLFRKARAASEDGFLTLSCVSSKNMQAQNYIHALFVQLKEYSEREISLEKKRDLQPSESLFSIGFKDDFIWSSLFQRAEEKLEKWKEDEFKKHMEPSNREVMEQEMKPTMEREGKTLEAIFHEWVERDFEEKKKELRAWALEQLLSQEWKYDIHAAEFKNSSDALIAGSFQCDMAALIMVTALKHFYHIDARVVVIAPFKQVQDPSAEVRTVLDQGKANHAVVEVFWQEKDSTRVHFRTFDPTPREKATKGAAEVMADSGFGRRI